MEPERLPEWIGRAAVDGCLGESGGGGGRVARPAKLLEGTSEPEAEVASRAALVCERRASSELLDTEPQGKAGMPFVVRHRPNRRLTMPARPPASFAFGSGTLLNVLAIATSSSRSVAPLRKSAIPTAEGDLIRSGFAHH